jgi:hypothetical protein
LQATATERVTVHKVVIENNCGVPAIATAKPFEFAFTDCFNWFNRNKPSKTLIC